MAYMSFLFILSGCLANQFTLKRNMDLTDKFESYTPLAGYTYYYSGPEAAPDAVLGMKEGHVLKSEFWQPVAVDEKRLKDWSTMLGTYNAPRFEFAYYGNYIFAQDGTEIGIWYCYTGRATIIKLEENLYNVYTPKARNLAQRRRVLFGINND